MMDASAYASSGARLRYLLLVDSQRQQLVGLMYSLFRWSEPCATAHSTLYNKAGARRPAASRWQAVVCLARYYGTHRSRLPSWLCNVGANLTPPVWRMGNIITPGNSRW